MTELEEGLVLHGCDAQGKRSNNRSFNVLEIKEGRSSYSNDQVKIRYLNSGARDSIGKSALQKGIQRGTYREGNVANCTECNTDD